MWNMASPFPLYQFLSKSISHLFNDIFKFLRIPINNGYILWFQHFILHFANFFPQLILWDIILRTLWAISIAAAITFAWWRIWRRRIALAIKIYIFWLVVAQSCFNLICEHWLSVIQSIDTGSPCLLLLSIARIGVFKVDYLLLFCRYGKLRNLR